MESSIGNLEAGNGSNKFNKEPLPAKLNAWVDGKLPDAVDDGEQQIIEAGEAKYHRLGWKGLTVMLIVEAIGLGSLSIPSAFASLGMVAGVICCVGIGLIAIYTSYVIGQVKLAFPAVRDYGDAGALLMGTWGRELFTFMLILQLIFLTGSNCLTGTIALRHITSSGICSVVWSVVSANIVFAYTFASCLFSFMDEMHTPKEFTKSIWSLGILQIVIYTVTGATIYAFVGVDVQSPALLSAGTLVSKVAFGIALPVIFISGAICTIVAGRLIHGRIYANSVTKYINTPKGWITWLTVITILTIISWVIAEAIPFFDDLLSITSALFTSGFSFYLPPIMWYVLIRKGPWYSKENLLTSLVNLFVFIFGLVVLVGGLYSSIQDIV
ncbi:hypothetical protein ASPNIDRAFT_184012, partial [Aspergillus niger ATCC 1015]